MAPTKRQTRPTRRAVPARRPAPQPVPRASGAVLPREQLPPRAAHPHAQNRARVRAHAWDAGVFFSVMLLLLVGLIALFSASYANAMFYQGSATHFISRQGLAHGGLGPVCGGMLWHGPRFARHSGREPGLTERFSLYLLADRDCNFRALQGGGPG